MPIVSNMGTCNVILSRPPYPPFILAGAMVEGNDGSLFYDADVKALTMTSSTQKFLPSELYAQMVRDCIICCVDCIIVRASPISGLKECLLVERGTEPVKGTWWWPGGRMYKGETFFDGAVRKTREETGLGGARPRCPSRLLPQIFPTGQCTSALAAKQPQSKAE